MQQCYSSATLGMSLRLDCQMALYAWCAGATWDCSRSVSGRATLQQSEASALKDLLHHVTAMILPAYHALPMSEQLVLRRYGWQGCSSVHELA